MNTNIQGSLGEFKAMQVFALQGYYIYQQAVNASPFDLAIYKDGELLRVEVKTSNHRAKSKGLKYEVKLRSKRGHMANSRELPFSKEDNDIVFIYIPEHDFYKIFKSEELDGMSTKTVEVIKGL